MKRSIIFLFFAVLFTFSTNQIAWALEIGKPAPNCTLNFNNSTTQQLKQLQGKVLYVDFWASWCGPCAKSFPFLNNLHHNQKERGLEIIGINLDEKPEDAQSFLSEYPSDFLISIGNNQACATNFEVKAMPSSYLIDKKGNIRHILLGFKPDESKEIATVVEQLLSE